MKADEVKSLTKDIQLVSLNSQSSLTLTTKLFRLIVILVSVIVILIIARLDINPIYSIKKTLKMPSIDLQTLPNVPGKKKFLIDLPGCQIPFMKPYSSSVIKFIEPPEKFQCSGSDLFSQKLKTNQISIRKDILKTHDYTVEEIKCFYREFRRRPPVGNQWDDKIAIDPTWIPFTREKGQLVTPILVKEEFIQVVCNDSANVTFYKDFYFFIPTTKVKRKLEIPKESKDYLNVVLTGIDAISRINLYRQLPKSVQYIQTELDAVEMIGYNKIGDNTFPNLMGVTTGSSENEIQNGCLAKSKYHRFDNCSLIWKDYNRTGYVTVFGEDATSMGLFNYYKKGFENLTTDYDYRCFDRFVDKEIGNHNFLNARVCFGKRLRSKVFLDYQQEFVTTFKNHPHFAFFWSVSASHDYLNLAGILDSIYFNFFNNLKMENLINKTALIFMSDHGIRWGGIRSTYQGRLEERLPFLFFMLPTWFQQKYSLAWKNLQINTKRLTTPYDLHATLKDLKNLDTLTNEKIQERTDQLATQAFTRGISLFLEIFPERTCEMAAIDEHWCACQKSNEIDIETPIVRNISQFLVNKINSMLNGYRQCATLKLDKINSASMVDYSQLLKKNENKKLIEEYSLVFKTIPGGGNFEATVRVTNDEKIPFELSGTISRINLYGSQSRCISDFHLKLYCFCV